MAIIQGIVKEEYERLNVLKGQYEERISGLHKGTLSKKKRNNKEYLYVARREGKRVLFEYIGVIDSDNAKKIIQEIEERKGLEKKLREVKAELKKLERLLNVK